MKQLSISVNVLTDGNRTNAESTMYDYTTLRGVNGNGSAGRERDDKANASIGEDLAVARSLESMAAHLKKRAQGKINHIESIKQHKAEIADRKLRTEADPNQNSSVRAAISGWPWDKPVFNHLTNLPVDSTYGEPF